MKSKHYITMLVILLLACLSIKSEPLSRKIRQKDSMKMRLIPAGEFSMGDHRNIGEPQEKPVHTVYLDAYWIDETEVTNEQYCIFLNQHRRNTDIKRHKLIDLDHEDTQIEKVGDIYIPRSGYGKYPVAQVSWYGAAAYAQWVSACLPTEAQWEKAARGGLIGKNYPWGDKLTGNDANCRGYYCQPGRARDIWPRTSPVASFPANGYGLYDMAGNVEEWCADRSRPDYYNQSPYKNPTGPETQIFFINNDFAKVETSSVRVLRGGSCYHSTYSYSRVRCAFRNFGGPHETAWGTGFRCSQKYLGPTKNPNE